MPDAQVVKEKVPDSWAVNPYPVRDAHIEWLLQGHSGTPESRRLHDEDAADEAQRKEHNLLNCDGYINIASVVSTLR